MGARICPRCSTRVDERRAQGSPFCLSCGSPLGAPSPTFAGKKPGGGGGSALPWILGSIGVVGVVNVVGVVISIAAAGVDSDPKPVAAPTPAAPPRDETPAT